MDGQWEQIEAEELVISVCSLLEVIFQISPEGEDQVFGDEIYLTLLDKARQDASKLRNLIVER